jgi:hypothetical protein
MQFSSWQECSTRTGRAIVPEVTGLKRGNKVGAHGKYTKRARSEPRGYRDRPKPKLGQSLRFFREACDHRGSMVGVELGFAMVMMMVMVVIRSRGKRRGGEHQDQEHGSKNLFHGENLAQRRF